MIPLKAVPPSGVLSLLEKTFGKALTPIDTALIPREERYYSIESAATAAGECYGSTHYRAWLPLFAEHPDHRMLDARLGRPIANADAAVSPETVGLLWKNSEGMAHLGMTQSRLDRYKSCPFSYWCQYELGLSEEHKTEFASNIIGSYVHLLLELFFKAIEEEKKDVHALTEEEILHYARESAEKARRAFFPESAKESARVSYMLGKLDHLSELLIREMADEFAQSGFSPLAEELEIGKGGGPERVSFALDNTEISFGGIIDRVDAMEKDGKLYIRVVDYKTGVKDFKPDDIGEGKNLQILLYLIALWKSRSEGFRRRIGFDGEIVPACVEYLAVGGKDVKSNTPVSKEESLALAKAQLTRTGMVLDDEEILTAMDKERTGRFLPVKPDKNGSFAKHGENFFTLERMGELLDDVSRTVVEVGKELKAGVARTTPAPFSVGSFSDSPCTYCPIKPVCRNVREK